MKTKLTRDELYKLVWDTPITRLSKQYGLSDVGFAKICKKLNVPVPPRGYWARVKSGQKPKRAPLPTPKANNPMSYTFIRENQNPSHPKNQIIMRDDALQLIERIRKNWSQLRVPSRLVSPDPLISEVKQEMIRCSPDKYGVVQPWKKKLLNIRVAPENIQRALIIMNYILKQIRKLGGDVIHTKMGYGPAQETRCISFFGARVEFYLEEKVDRSDYQPSRKEKEESKKSFWQTYPKWTYKTSGKLTLRIDFNIWGNHGLRKFWSDRTSKLIEDQIPDFFVGVIKAANALRDKKEKEKEEERLREIERQRWREIERQAQLEKEKLQQLEIDAENWERASRLRNYIKAVEVKTQVIHPAGLPDEMIEWLAWARNYTDKIDPLR